MTKARQSVAGRRHRLSARRQRILRTARLRRRAGQIMVVIAAVGVFTALAEGGRVTMPLLQADPR